MPEGTLELWMAPMCRVFSVRESKGARFLLEPGAPAVRQPVGVSLHQTVSRLHIDRGLASMKRASVLT